MQSIFCSINCASQYISNIYDDYITTGMVRLFCNVYLFHAFLRFSMLLSCTDIMNLESCLCISDVFNETALLLLQYSFEFHDIASVNSYE